MEYHIAMVDISLINKGDIVLHDGKLISVNKEDIKSCKFMGITLFGDSYSLGYKKVARVTMFHSKPDLYEKKV